MAVAAPGRVVSAFLLAALTLAACGHSATPPADGAASPTAPSPTAVGSTAVGPTAAAASGGHQCRHRYEMWRHGAAITAFDSDLRYLASKKNLDHVSRLTSVLKKAGSAAGSLPLPPQCADPAHYYSQILAEIKTTSDKARSVSGLGGLLTAEAPLKSLSIFEVKLSAELHETISKSF